MKNKDKDNMRDKAWDNDNVRDRDKSRDSEIDRETGRYRDSDDHDSRLSRQWAIHIVNNNNRDSHPRCMSRVV